MWHHRRSTTYICTCCSDTIMGRPDRHRPFLDLHHALCLLGQFNGLVSRHLHNMPHRSGVSTIMPTHREQWECRRPCCDSRRVAVVLSKPVLQGSVNCNGRCNESLASAHCFLNLTGTACSDAHEQLKTAPSSSRGPFEPLTCDLRETHQRSMAKHPMHPCSFNQRQA